MRAAQLALTSQQKSLHCTARRWCAGVILLFALLGGGGADAAWQITGKEALNAPAGVEFSRIVVSEEGRTAELHVAAFSAKTHALAVVDNPDGSLDVSTAAEARGALAAVNGGYFHPDRTPLGLVVNGGSALHPLERAKLLSGVVAVFPDRIALLRTGEFTPTPRLREALQAGPFLVDGGKAVAGLNAVRSAERTVVASDGAGRMALLISGPVTLAELGQILSQCPVFPARKTIRALNLDGGSSTGMWVRSSPPFYHREAKTVRNFLAITSH